MSLLAAAPRAVRQSAALRRCLGLCLRLGNALNRGTARGDAAGFDVTLTPLTLTLTPKPYPYP